MTAPTARELIQRLTDHLEHATDHNYQQALKAQARAFLAAKLSPAAKFVLNAVLPLSDEDLLYTCTDEQYAARMAAVALQAAANVVAPEAMPHRRKIRDEILAIAAELETFTTENR
jgi:hypothetical protein